MSFDEFMANSILERMLEILSRIDLCAEQKLEICKLLLKC